ncbi:DNA cytosine methyltransferase [Brevibacillus humidisoli]|uniref:DNA cytosine methyltransferase n=1 Tax=Brevibacillus humidisoli TaxID=2895522 RepID=UPI001E307974|nr:DNA cytosine methyltransferase [Brevibacillus humidisoli]UFJ41622.1 DNA cytosine methyltransferase [Brevibacillus humidisoli]
MNSLEICAGAGGQALGLELAGFEHAALVEIESPACATLRLNRPHWNVIEDDLRNVSGKHFKGIDLLAGGVPCPPFSKAGKQLGQEDERDLFPEAIRMVEEIQPKAVMLENVRGLLDAVFDDYREKIVDDLRKMGYTAEWKLLNASDFGVPQLRPRVVFVAIRNDLAHNFSWPKPLWHRPPTVGETLYDLMAENGWFLANRWKDWANDIAPTIVGGSKKHGGPDLGPTRAKRAWAALGVDGMGIADQAPEPNFIGLPRLTTRMVARLQGFPDSWQFFGKKTPAYRQIGNAFPPPVAQAVGLEIRKCLEAGITINLKRIHRL